MSVVKDTVNLKPYKFDNLPKMDASMLPFLGRELTTISNSLNACIVALKSIEARIVAGGL